MSAPSPQGIVIFGASGDLAKRKLIPSLFALFLRGLLPDRFFILGVSRTKMDSEDFRALRRADILAFSESGANADSEKLEAFLNILFYESIDTENPEAYSGLADVLNGLSGRFSTGANLLFYLGTPPDMFLPIARGLKASGLNSSASGWRRIVVEKPFGRDLESSRNLNAELLKVFNEREIFRIDHYLGKETVQNILVLRFANGIFEPLWNRNYIDSVEISVSETLGVEGRGAYYEKAGALRDMVQNHLLHLMAFAAMECPASLDSESLRDEVVKVFRSLHPLSEKDLSDSVFRGQYAAGEINGEKVNGYLGEKNVSADSHTETYVAMRFFIDNWRWGGVPFYLYTGKRLSERKSEITINFKSTPQNLFIGQCCGHSCNRLSLRIQPDESISLKFGLKVPGEGFNVAQVGMNFKYSSLADVKLPGAYERLLLDAMCGDSSLFARADALECGWKFIDPILKYWDKIGYSDLARYAAGSEGTAAALALMRSHREISCSLPTVNGD